MVLRERTNLRHLQPGDLYGSGDAWPDLAVADVSFISLTRVLPALRRLLLPPGAGQGQSMGPEAVLLVKPQFEVGRERVGRGGVVRDPRAHCDAVLTVVEAAAELGWRAAGLVASPLTGPAGNHEYLLWLRDQDQQGPIGAGESAAGAATAAGPGAPAGEPGAAAGAEAHPPSSGGLDGSAVAAVVARTLKGGAP